MRPVFACSSLLFLAAVSLGFAQQQGTQEKPKDAAPAATAAATEVAKPADNRKNPVGSTPEVLASAKKMFGYDCAMCHGSAGDGKGDMVESMKLTMRDWKDPATLSAMSDGEIFDVITKGKGKMTGEGDRLPNDKVWGMVNYVRALAKKGGAAASADAAAKQ